MDGRLDTQAEGLAVHTVVTRSTVPPGTTTQLVGPTVAQAAGTSEGIGFVLAASPEFLRGDSADDDARWPWMTVIGARSRRVAERLCSLLEPFGGEVRVVDRPETAELVKCAHNLYNATKISFWNEMWLVAGRLGVDPDEVAGIVARSSEASRNPVYGIRGGAPFARPVPAQGHARLPGVRPRARPADAAARLRPRGQQPARRPGRRRARGAGAAGRRSRARARPARAPLAPPQDHEWTTLYREWTSPERGAGQPWRGRRGGTW